MQVTDANEPVIGFCAHVYCELWLKDSLVGFDITFPSLVNGSS